MDTGRDCQKSGYKIANRQLLREHHWP